MNNSCRHSDLKIMIMCALCLVIISLSSCGIVQDNTNNNDAQVNSIDIPSDIPKYTDKEKKYFEDTLDDFRKTRNENWSFKERREFFSDKYIYNLRGDSFFTSHNIDEVSVSVTIVEPLVTMWDPYALSSLARYTNKSYINQINAPLLKNEFPPKPIPLSERVFSNNETWAIKDITIDGQQDKNYTKIFFPAQIESRNKKIKLKRFDQVYYNDGIKIIRPSGYSGNNYALTCNTSDVAITFGNLFECHGLYKKNIKFSIGIPMHDVDIFADILDVIFDD